MEVILNNIHEKFAKLATDNGRYELGSRKRDGEIIFQYANTNSCWHACFHTGLL